MNMKQFILSLGVEGLIKHYKALGFKNLGEYIESVPGEPCDSYGVGWNILLSEETWELLEAIVKK